jgi:hypothetical protein
MVAGNSLADTIVVSDVEVYTVGPELAVDHPSPTSPLLQSLRNCIDTLPTTVGLASKVDIISRFSGDPT